MRFEDMRNWGSWRLQPSGIKTIAYYEKGKKQSWYAAPLWIFGIPENLEINLNHYGKKGYMNEQDYVHLQKAVTDLTNDGTIAKEYKKHGDKYV